MLPETGSDYTAVPVRTPDDEGYLSVAAEPSELKPTNSVEPEVQEFVCRDGKVKRFGKGIGEAVVDGKVLAWNDPLTAKLRSKTFTGIARAMAEQWG